MTTFLSHIAWDYTSRRASVSDPPSGKGTWVFDWARKHWVKSPESPAPWSSMIVKEDASSLVESTTELLPPELGPRCLLVDWRAGRSIFVKTLESMVEVAVVLHPPSFRTKVGRPHWMDDWPLLAVLEVMQS